MSARGRDCRAHKHGRIGETSVRRTHSHAKHRTSADLRQKSHHVVMLVSDRGNRRNSRRDWTGDDVRYELAGDLGFGAHHRNGRAIHLVSRLEIRRRQTNVADHSTKVVGIQSLSGRELSPPRTTWQRRPQQPGRYAIENNQRQRATDDEHSRHRRCRVAQCPGVFGKSDSDNRAKGVREDVSKRGVPASDERQLEDFYNNRKRSGKRDRRTSIHASPPEREPERHEQNDVVKDIEPVAITAPDANTESPGGRPSRWRERDGTYE